MPDALGRRPVAGAIALWGCRRMVISFAVLAGVVVLFVWNRLPVEVVAIGAGLTLYATGVIELDDVLAGFGDPSVVFIATLFVVSEGLDMTGVTAWTGQQMVARVGSSRGPLLVSVMVLVAFLTALVSVSGAVAALLPMVVVLAVRVGRSPAQLLMPLAFAAHAGSMLALTGTPVNVIVSDAAAEAGGGRFGYLEFALAGVPLLVGTVVIVVVVGDRLLPDRTPATMPPDLSDHPATLARHYRLHGGIVRLRVRSGSELVGRRHADLDLSDDDVSVLLVRPGDGSVPDPGRRITPGDVVVVRGTEEAVEAMAVAHDLAPRSEVTGSDVARGLVTREWGVTEVIIPPRSSAIGRHVFPGMVTTSGDLVILAIEREHRSAGPDGITLAAGDTMLLQGTWDALDDQVDDDAEVLVVDGPAAIRRQAVPLGRGSTRAIAVLVAMVVLLAGGLVPTVVAGQLAAGALVVTGVLTIDQAYRAISWTTVLLVAGMIPMSTAMRESGAAERLAEGLVAAVGDSSPYLLAAGLFVVTMVLGQLISNMATALIVIPIAVSAAAETGVSGRPLLMTVNIAAAAAFLTPVATPVNMMVMRPAGYRFGDYWRLGTPLMAWFFVVAVFLVPAIWRF